MKSFLLTALTLCFLALTALPCSAAYEKQLVYDLADILTDEEEAELQVRAASLAEEQQADIVLLTTADSKGKSAQEYADDFYDDNGFGYGAEYGPGVLCLIDMDGREVAISTGGDTESRVINAFTEDEIENVLDRMFEHLPDGDYYGAFLSFISATEGVLNGGDTDDYYYGGYDYDDYYGSVGGSVGGEPVRGRWYQRLSVWPIIIGLVIGAVCVSVMRKNSAGVMSAGAANYEISGSRRIIDSRDAVMNVAHHTRVIPKDPPQSKGGGLGGGFTGGGIHTSSGGHVHGGGSRHF